MNVIILLVGCVVLGLCIAWRRPVFRLEAAPGCEQNTVQPGIIMRSILTALMGLLWLVMSVPWPNWMIIPAWHFVIDFVLAWSAVFVLCIIGRAAHPLDIALYYAVRLALISMILSPLIRFVSGRFTEWRRKA